MRRKWLVLIFGSFFLHSFSQSKEEVLRFADEQFYASNYPNALKEYQRYLFFARTPEPKILHSVGECYYNLGQFEKAASFFDKAFYLWKEDTSRLNELFSKADCEIQVKEYGMALIDLLGYSDSIKDDNYYRMQFYQGLCYFGMEDFSGSEIAFIASLGPGREKEKKLIRELYLQRKYFYKPNPRSASFLSMFIPGLGQFYAGDVKNGINSLVLTGLLTYLGFHIALNQSAIDGIMIVFPWFQRYYQGGIIRAEKIATTRRKERRSNQLDKILDIVASTRNP